MKEEKLCGGKTFKEVMDEVNFHIHDKHKIEQLQKENAELKKDKEWLDNTNNEQTEIILKLNEQIEKMKCCGNCSKNKLFIEDGKLKCEGNVVTSLSSDIKITVCDEWKLAE